MIPRLAAQGSSFQGAFLYYCHDKQAKTTARVAWTETVNMMTSCTDKAWKVMAYTAKSAEKLKEATGQFLSGKKMQKPVLSYSLSWHPEQKPDKDTMLEAAKESLQSLGLEEHEVMIAAHKDEPQPHVHVVVNKVHPLTGMSAKLDYSKRKLSDWAREYERKEGKIYCKQREKNHQKREQGQHSKYVDPVIAEAWTCSRNAEEFELLLEDKGYQLARGRKRLVVVDAHGKTINPVRHIKNVKSKEFHQCMAASIDLQKLPIAEAVIEQVKQRQQEYDRKLKRHHEKAEGYLTDQKTRQSQERKKLEQNHDLKITNERKKLISFYKFREQTKEINDLKNRLSAPKLLPRFIRKAFGLDEKLQKELTAKRQVRAEAKKHFDTDLEKLEKDRDKDLSRIERRHSREREDLCRRLEQWKPQENSRYIQRSRRERERRRLQDRGYQGPSLGR